MKLELSKMFDCNKNYFNQKECSMNEISIEEAWILVGKHNRQLTDGG